MGLAESPAGKFALSSVTAMLAFVFVLVELVGAVPPHPSETTNETKNMNSADLLCINLKNNVPIWRLRPNEGSDGGQTGTGRLFTLTRL